MNRKKAHIGCIDGKVLEVWLQSDETVLVSGNTKVRLSMEAAANLGGLLVSRSYPEREISTPHPSPQRGSASTGRPRNRKRGQAITPKILEYITRGRPHTKWDVIAYQLNRDKIRTVTNMQWTGHNLECQFERYAAGFSPYADLL